MPAPASSSPQPRSFLFGAFLLQPEQQRLLMDDKPVRIGGRALDLLTALVERPGEVLSKRELVSRAWPDVFVDEGNLKVNMGILRRVLGETPAMPRFIATVTGRGYRFIAPVQAAGIARAAPYDGWRSSGGRGNNPDTGSSREDRCDGAKLLSLSASYSFRLATGLKA
jgi:DNA-binding winged helix-turn-helix (wHTH) protein